MALKTLCYLQLIITSHVPSSRPHKAAIEQNAIISFGTATHSCMYINKAACKTSVSAKILLRPMSLANALATAAAIVFAKPKQIIT